MAMAVDNRQQLHLGGMPYDQIRYQAPPQFTNPWTSSNQTAHLYSQPPQQQLPPVSAGLENKSFQPLTPTSAPQAPQFAPTSFDHVNSPLENAQGIMSQSRPYGQDYSSPATSQPSPFAPTSTPQYGANYPQYSSYGQDPSQRPSYTQRAPHLGREGFNEALDASRSIAALSQDLTPRNIYGSDAPRQGAQDAYGFPAPHSAHSSISSASTYPSYYNGSIGSSVGGSIAGSVDGSVTDYSSAGEEVMGGRTLPRPILNGALPPAASSMMSQFNSKIAPSTQKKHKCKICDKRFTRPSSLQTHMYSHTGEKPFACDAPGCGRHFSVVSNLRRHKKVHRNDGDRASPDED